MTKDVASRKAIKIPKCINFCEEWVPGKGQNYCILILRAMGLSEADSVMNRFVNMPLTLRNNMVTDHKLQHLYQLIFHWKFNLVHFGQKAKFCNV